MVSAIRKSFILLSCSFLGLICGTLYLYSSYSPQFAKRLNYTVTNSSSIALLGTLGTALAGPTAGMVVDKKGFTVALLIGGVSISMGYLGLKRQYDHQISNVALSAFLNFMIGLGSTFINSSSLKCCAVTLPSLRGIATALPLSSYGLSALFYSVIGSLLFPGDTSKFLALLAYSSMLIFVVCAPVVMYCDLERKFVRPVQRKKPTVEVFEMASMSSPGSNTLTTTQSPRKHVPSTSSQKATSNISGMELLTNVNFWGLFILTGALAGMGQMYIYSVGYMVKALVTSQMSTETNSLTQSASAIEKLLQGEQQMQVSMLSVTNCAGRIVSGIVGDIFTHTFKASRSWLLFIPCIGSLFTQLMGYRIESITSLFLDSLLTGFFYGFTFCLMPVLVGDYFGIENFSYNWGIVGLAPIAPSFYFASLFGKIYDSNSVKSTETNNLVCNLGKGCYNSIFKLTFGLSIFASTILILLLFNERRSKGTLVSYKK